MHKNLAVPSARAASQMCAIGKNLVIFGGAAEQRMNDLHIYNTGEFEERFIRDVR